MGDGRFAKTQVNAADGFGARKDEVYKQQQHYRFNATLVFVRNMASDNDDEGGLWKGPSSVQEQRRRISSTAASLLDNHDEDEEDGTDEPDLLSVSIESASDSSGQSRVKMPPGAVDKAIGPTLAEDDAVSSVVRLTEGMTGMLCSASLEGADTVVAMNLTSNHRRIDSETEVFQKSLASTGNCGASPPFCMPSKETAGDSTRDMETTFNESLTMFERIDSVNNFSESALEETESTLNRSDTLRKNEPMNCAEFNLYDLQTLVATDIIGVLGSSTGVAAAWFATLSDWLVPSNHESQQLPRRVFRNRCSVRKAQSHRLKELWYKWHSNGSDDSSSRIGTNQSECSDPMKSNPNMPPFRLWSLAVTKSLDDAELVAPLTSINGAPLSHSFDRDRGRSPLKEAKLFSSGKAPKQQRAPTPPVDLYYDSDPEIFRVTRHSPAAAANKDDYITKKPLRWRRRVSLPTPINTSLSVDGSIHREMVRPLTPRHVKGKGAPSFDIGSFDSDADDRFDLLDDTLVKEFIKVSKAIELIPWICY